ncbi:leucine-rich repeat-containing protein 46 [Biomphalaria glabrata]|uniref:Leucine-rich repeat-containing protein 46-like n=1 Tax=Biomphalaria glabrata TaxID=6526 RepID=A0A9W2ZGD4_BIOGL|nr:leucine-rich repeat-containing protein 46-like [Biomphalaria glabrata]KAI8768324.1 leucine-rich repeat-containing protein 46-like [Biomphalaria glabrata]KAI8777498.1 leucine-rich repeat-containing protein 46 [Biomphalaria glabrata]
MAAIETQDDAKTVKQTFNSWVDEVFKENDSKPVCLSLHLIVQRHLPPESSEWSHEEIIKELNKKRRIRLDRENIGQIDSCELLSADVTHLYLQFNKISKIENLECLPNLQVLILSENKITTIENIDHLNKLVFLDVSNNLIEEVQAENLPQSIIILNLSGNPCVSQSYKSNIIKRLPKLKHLDGAEILKEDKLEAGVEVESICGNNENQGEETTDEEEGSEDEDDAEETVTDNIARKGKLTAVAAPLEAKSLIGYKKLPQIPANIHDLATNILLRSQSRMEERTKEYKKHLQEMTNIKILSKIKPIPHNFTQKKLPDLK